MANWHKALSKLRTGDFEEGLKLFEWRWESVQKEYGKNFSQPLWLGDQPVAGKTLLIHSEQGLGDVIQMCRYVPMVEALGAKVLLEIPGPIVSLISTLKGGCTVVIEGGDPPSSDLHCPIMSLPLAFRTTAASIPAPIPYLYADPAKQKLWRRRLGNRTKPRVGLAWSGNAAHPNDHNRSIPFRLLEPWLQLPIEFHVLQREIRPEDAAALSKSPNIHRHQDELSDFSDTAALAQEMDLVVSVDTAIAHVAGALGKNVWILLPHVPDWRWLLDRPDSPWYPTATLFRQPAIGDWSSVIADVAAQLGRL